MTRRLGRCLALGILIAFLLIVAVMSMGCTTAANRIVSNGPPPQIKAIVVAEVEFEEENVVAAFKEAFQEELKKQGIGADDIGKDTLYLRGQLTHNSWIPYVRVRNMVADFSVVTNAGETVLEIHSETTATAWESKESIARRLAEKMVLALMNFPNKK